MKLSQTFFTLLATTFFVACGDNTTTSPITDVASISINDRNLSLYSTDISISTASTVTYLDGSTTNATADMEWISSDDSTLLTSSGAMYPRKNGGDVNVTIDYQSKFNDSVPVQIKELLSINYSDLNISDVGNPQILYTTGNFKNGDTNETNVTMNGNIYWITDENATISEINATQMTITIDYNTTSILLTTSLFINTENQQDFNKTFH